MFAMSIREAFLNADDAGIYLNYRTDGGVFNTYRYRELLFADNCAIMAHTCEHIQNHMVCFTNDVKRFGLTISLEKTEVILQPRPGSIPIAASAAVCLAERINSVFVTLHNKFAISNTANN